MFSAYSSPLVVGFAGRKCHKTDHSGLIRKLLKDDQVNSPTERQFMLEG